MSKKELDSIFGKSETLNDLISLFEKRYPVSFVSNETVNQRKERPIDPTELMESIESIDHIESIDDIDIYLNV